MMDYTLKLRAKTNSSFLKLFGLSLKQIGKAGPRVAVASYSCTVSWSPFTGQPGIQNRPWPPSADLELLCGEEVDADESKLSRPGGHTGILGQLSRKLHGMWGPGLWTAAADELMPHEQRPHIQCQHLWAPSPLDMTRPRLSLLSLTPPPRRPHPSSFPENRTTPAHTLH